LGARAGVVGGRRAAAGLRRGRVRSRARSPQDPRSPRGTERAAGGYPARQRPASVRASRSAPGALVGYTNAGKSSLMRALTDSEVLVADKLFATLDTTLRALQ